MSSERTQYASSILVSQSPINATEIVRVRLSQAKLLNDEFSNFFKRYYAIKSNYLSELNRLVSETHDLNQNIEHSIIEKQVLSKEELKHYNVDAIGNLSEIWNKIISEIKDELAANNLLRTVVDKEVINPLTGFTTRNKQWSDVRELHSKLSEVAQTIEYNQEKIEKYAGHPDKQGKYEAALESANHQWDNEAPYVFEVFENTDYNRLEFLRDSLLRFITAYTDSLNKISQSNEKTLETILNFDPETEISRFAKVSSETTFIPKEARKAAESPVIKQKSSFSQPSSASTGAGLRHSSVSTTATSATTVNNGKAPKQKTKLRSKVGSIFHKKKKKDKKRIGIEDTVPESEASSINEFVPPTTVRESRTSSFVSSSGPQDYAKRSINLPEPVAKNSPAPTQPSQFGSSSSSVPAGTPAPLSFTQAPLQPKSRSNSSGNVSSQEPFSSGPVSQVSTTSSPFHIQPPKAQPAQVFQQSPLHFQQQQETAAVPEEPVTAAPTLAPAPLEHKAPAPPPSRRAVTSSNLGNIREDGQHEFHATAPPPPIQPPGTNRRDIHSQLFTNLNQTAPENRRLSSLSSFGDSIRQLNPQSTGSSLMTPGIFQHSTLDKPGLNASIAEVVNAKFKDGEQVSAQTAGEIALRYNNSHGDIPQKSNVKINANGVVLSKVIPNPSFFKQIDTDEFELVPAAIENKTVGALKYQIKDIVAPIIVLPVWRFEPHQASVMMSIKLAPHVAEKLGPNESVFLSNLVVSTAINGQCTSVLSKPTGTFSKERSRMTWRFPEPVELTTTNEHKLLARFMTNGLASESEQGVAIKFNIDFGKGSELVSSGVELSAHNVEEDDPFAQESWNDIPSYKTLVSGLYNGLA